MALCTWRGRVTFLIIRVWERELKERSIRCMYQSCSAKLKKQTCKKFPMSCGHFRGSARSMDTRSMWAYSSKCSRRKRSCHLQEAHHGPPPPPHTLQDTLYAAGYDFPCMLQNVVPFGLWGGSRMHDEHHRLSDRNYQKFFTFLDSATVAGELWCQCACQVQIDIGLRRKFVQARNAGFH